MKFAQRLKELRLEKHLSTRDLAKEIGVTNITISRWENNKASATHEKIILLCQFFNVSADYLLGLKDFE